MKLEAGQKWKQRNGDVATVKVDDQAHKFFSTDLSNFLYTAEESDGVFYVFDADILNGYDLVELVG